MAKAKVTSIDQYIASKPEKLQLTLRRLRKAIHEAVPGLEESISYQIPALKRDGVPVLYFAGWSTHLSLYPAGDALVEAFKKELVGYKRSKGTIQFPLSEPLPIHLIQRIAKYRAKKLTEREKGKNQGKGRVAQLERVRRICSRMPSVWEKLSHGTPTFFVKKDKGVFTMFADNHHNDGHLAVWVPTPHGLQSALIEDDTSTYFKPPYVGASGWIGIELDRIRDEALEIHIRKAWDMTSGAKKKATR
jgi:uncharacterized protein YdhG (YjbR/CyaY superfamily)